MRTMFSWISDTAGGKVGGSACVQPYRQAKFGRLAVPG
jgi:hypothetical protein